MKFLSPIDRCLSPLLLAALAILLVACGNGSDNPPSTDDSNSLALRVAVPDPLQADFCARFEITGPGMTTLIVEHNYPANSQYIEAVLTDIPQGNRREVTLGLFEQRNCADFDTADWIGKASGIRVRAGEVTRVELAMGVGNGDTGTIIVGGGFIERQLHGEVVDIDNALLAGAKCLVSEGDQPVAEGVSDDEGVLNIDVEVASATEFLGIDCRLDNHNPASAVAVLRGDPGGFMIFGVTVEMRPFLSAPSIVVDTKLRPTLNNLPPANANGASRPLVAMADERGNVAHFAANEMILASNNNTSVDELIAAWNGELLGRVDFANTGLEMTNLHLIRIDTALADTSTLMEDLEALDGAIRGAHRVSSESGLALIAAGARAARNGLQVGLNWVGSGDSITSGSTTEAANGDGAFTAGGYSPDAFDWNYMNGGSVQDIGVAPAWRLLSNLGRLGNRQRLAILDMGFTPAINGDIANDFIGISNVPFVSPIGTSNLGSCGSPCPWHGTNVANAAMGLVDNGIGAAGPGGPVARPVLVFTSYDFFTGISALAGAYASGARIMNMSYGAAVPAIVSWSVLPFEATTVAMRAGGAIMTASAGNDGDNVDAEDCGPFGLICWEEAWHTPCENAGVMCVGGIGNNTTAWNRSSNYGNRQVDMFAPYSLLIGRDQSARFAVERAHQTWGTSFSAPFVAGVAALVKAANPSLDGRAVAGVLRRSAHESSHRFVRRYVNALGAVREALGTAVNITGPIDGTRFPRGSTLNFNAEAFSNSRSGPSFVWRSDRETAPIGNGPSVSRIDLATGWHEITVTATFSDGFTVNDSVRIEIINTPPILSIDAPTYEQTFFASQPILLRGRSVDSSSPETGFRLRDDQVQWSVRGIFAGRGHTVSFAGGRLPAGGPYRVLFSGSDGTTSVERSTVIFILPDPDDLPPVVTIASPLNNASFSPTGADSRGLYADVPVVWEARDPEEGLLPFSSTQWTTSINGGAPETLPITVISLPHPTLPITFTIYTMRLYAPESFGNSHDIELRATDSNGNVGRATIRLIVNVLS